MTKSFDFSAQSLQQLAHGDVTRALAEDVGAGDLTAGLIDPGRMARARVLARESAVVCGQAWVQAAILALDPQAQITWYVQDGGRCEANQVVFEVEGRAQALLTAERTALNFLQLLSAVATKTATYVAVVAGTRAAIVDTRKTLPGLRLAQKYAVRCGGGTNHRVGLYDAVLIKETTSPRQGASPRCCSRPTRLRPRPTLWRSKWKPWISSSEALDAGARMVLLDNMGLPTLQEAVRINPGARFWKSPAASRWTVCARWLKPASTASPSAR
jgi:nicotinate-nucleotide pyrophosphorylase (carboxylating)